jgi:hypothetical protein
MKLRHTAALALVGWYLMTPPITLKGLADPKATLIDGSAPISQWSQESSFDSAEKCEQERKAEEQLATEALQQNPHLLDDRAKYGLQAMDFLLKRSAQCIATDDPRLAK